MVLDRKTLLAALSLLVVGLAQWPLRDQSLSQLALFGAWAAVVAVLGVSAELRRSRLLTGILGGALALYVGATIATAEGPGGAVVGPVALVPGAIVGLYG